MGEERLGNRKALKKVLAEREREHGERDGERMVLLGGATG